MLFISLCRFRKIAQSIYLGSMLAGFLCVAVMARETTQLSDGQPQEPPNQEAAFQPAPPDGQQPAASSPVAELEQLLQSEVETPALQQEVTTVSGQESTVGRSPAAVFVITQEMIRRSGATCIPEALRMAPGLQVARINSNQWTVTSRGFSNNIAGLLASNNKLLILIDGRTVYTPFFSGTYWDVQDLLLDDIERIEVIRGPGATIWGANAVNGVVNVITKRAADTQGGLARAGGGTFERGFASARMGGQIGENLHYRFYGKWFERGTTFNPTGPETDDWRQGRGGFRMDWTPTDQDTMTLQGDLYGGQSGFLNTATGPGFGDDVLVHGGNVLARWTRKLSDDNDVSLQYYYDRADRANDIGFVDQQFNTSDLDFRHHFLFNSCHNMVWGLGYRSVSDKLTPVTAPPAAVLFFNPAQRTYDTFSAFVQDEITLQEHLFLTLGTKLQHNDFTGWEVQPTIRMLYSPEESWATWAAVSRAVRTPSRLEHDATIAAGTIPILQFSNAFQSEELIAYELGYRSQPEPWYSWDASLFFNQYERLASFQTTPATVFPIFNSNRNRGEGYGIELSGILNVSPTWKLNGNYSFLHLQIHPGADTIDFLGSTGPVIEQSSPHNQFFLMSSHDLRDNVQLDFVGRYVDNLPIQRTPSYINLDIRLAWRPMPRTEITAVGQNLLDSAHPEFGGTVAVQMRRGIYAMVTHVW